MNSLSVTNKVSLGPPLGVAVTGVHLPACPQGKV